MRLSKTEKALRPVHANVGIAAELRRRLDKLLLDMTRSYAHWIAACYRANPPEMALDATAAGELRNELRRLGVRWQKDFNAAAPKLAKYFLKAAHKRSDAVLRKILKDGGISIEFKMTKAMRDIADASVAESVSLIKSIASQYHTEVEGLVMRSVVTGRDLSELAGELRKRYALTRKRAALIARDQNNKATAAFTRARQVEIGIQKAVWLHSHGGKEPRKTHIANTGKRYDVAKGWFDPDPRVNRHIWPGELINCRCVSKPIVKGFS